MSWPTSAATIIWSTPPRAWWRRSCSTIRPSGGSQRHPHERELCCDDLAVRACGDPVCFARALTPPPERLRIDAPVTVLASTGGSLMFRVRRLIGAGPQECAPSKLSGILAFSLAVTCLAVTAHPIRGQAAATAYTFTVDDSAGVSVDLGGAAILHRGRVTYPVAALSSGIQGTVAVQVTLDAAGNVADAHVVSGPMELRRAVMSSVFDSHFTQDSAGATRIVNVMFDRAVAAAAAAQGPHLVPGILGAVPLTQTVEGAPGTVSGQLRPDKLVIRPDIVGSEVQGIVGGVTGGLEGGVIGSVPEGRVEGVVGGVLGGVVQGIPDNAEFRVFAEDAKLASDVPMPNRVIKSIEIDGLSEAAKSDLQARINAHVGETIGQSFEKIAATVKQFDEHLNTGL